MKRVRTIVFWCHLSAGVLAGLVILIMSATGAALACRRLAVYIGRGLSNNPSAVTLSRASIPDLR